MTLRLIDNNKEADMPKDPAITFPFKCDNFQRHSFKCIENNENILLSVATGNGKTVPAIYATAYHIRKNKRVIYCTPIKTLSNQKYKEFKDIFSVMFAKEIGRDISVGLLTGDQKINPDADILIMTTEILCNALYKLKDVKEDISHFNIKEDLIQTLGCVILDEVHFINDPDRGKIWESTIVMIPDNIQLVMLSATINKPEEFATWIANIKSKPMNLITLNKRRIPLKHYIYCDEKLYDIMDNDGEYNPANFQIVTKKYDAINKLREKKHKTQVNNNLICESINFLNKKNLLSAIYFSFSRANCEKYANMVTKPLVDHKERQEIQTIFSHYMHKYEKQYQTLPQYINIKKVLANGVAYHHSGLIPILKEIVEIIFQKGLIKVLFATETFAVGVNSPSRSIVFTELQKHTGSGKRFINKAEYTQCSGRAGRAGFGDRLGHCIILPLYEMPTEQELLSVLKGKVPHIESKFKIDYQFILKAIQSESTNIKSFIEKSLFHKEHITIKNSLIKEIDILKNVIYETVLEATQDNITTFKILYDLEHKINTEFGFKLILPKHETKTLEKLKKDINSCSNQTKLYKQYCVLQKNTESLIKKESELEYYNNYVVFSCNTIIDYLRDIGYLINNEKTSENIDNKDVSQKGVIAAQINDCNAILLTEMIMEDYFVDLLPEEIIGVLAIFIDDAKKSEEIRLDDINGTDNIYNKLSKISGLIDKLQNLEKKNDIEDNSEYWKISYNYVDIAYGWATGMSLHELKDYFTTLYEGNFVKHMLKINNMIHTVKCLVVICNKLELLPVLEKTEGLLLRDIVNVNSLYLS
jgi:antiviral helicase SKI2